MKRILILGFVLISALAKAQTIGIKVAAPVIKNNPVDNTITGYADLLNGGYHIVPTKAGRDSLNTFYSQTLKIGMLAHVTSLDSTFKWSGTAWKPFATSADTLTYRTVANSRTLAQTQTALNLKANDNAVVHITGTETILGAKAFSQAVNLQSGYLLSTGGTVNGYSELTPTYFGTQFSTPGLAQQGQFFVDKTGFGTSGTGTNGTGSFLSGGIDSHIDYVTKTSNLKSELKIDGSGIVVTDAILSKGITLAQDYSANFTNESLVTRRFVTAADALKANDNAVVHLAGTETITGAKTFSSDVQIPAIPSNATSAASKSYIDNAITGITWKAAVRVATTANIVLSATQTIDAIVLAVGDRVLVKNQTAQAENGIYLVASAAWTRALDADSGTEIETATVAVTVGTINKNTQWTCTATSITIGTTAITFGQISGAGTYSASTGLTLTGNVFAIDGTVATLSGVQTLTNKSISGGQITSAVANATLASTVTTNANLTGIVTSTGNATSIADAALSIAKTSGLQTALDAKLNLTGGVITGAGSTVLEINSTAAATFVGMKDNSGNYVYLGSDDGNFKVQTPGSGFSDKLIISNAGNATFSNTVTAPTFIGALSGNATNVTGIVAVANGGTGSSTGETLQSVTSRSRITTTSLNSSGGQGRFGGWYNTGDLAGAGAEIGFIEGRSIITSYNRSLDTYLPLNFDASYVNVGVGNFAVGYPADQGYKLAVNGTGFFAGALTGTSANFSGSGSFGTTTSAYRLNVYDASGNLGELFQNDGTNNRRLLITATSTGANSGIKLNSTSSVGNDNLIFSVSNNEILRLTPTTATFAGALAGTTANFTGNVGIGTASAGAKLDVVVAQDANGYALAGFPFIKFSAGDVLDYGSFGPTWSAVRFVTNGIERLRLNNSGVQTTFLGAGVAPSASTRLLLTGGSTTISSLRIPTGVAPTTPIDGDFWRLTGRTQVYDGTVTKDVIFDKANSVLAGFGVGAVITDNLGNLSVAPAADRTTSNTITKTANYTVVLSDFGANGTCFISANATAGNMTITLPLASVLQGLTIIVKKTDASANTVTISSSFDGTGSVMDGSENKVYTTRYSGASMISNGSFYSIIANF